MYPSLRNSIDSLSSPFKQYSPDKWYQNIFVVRAFYSRLRVLNRASGSVKERILSSRVGLS